MGQDYYFGAFVRQIIISSDSTRAKPTNIKSGTVLASG
jgi:hypothetical protein